MSSVLLNLEHRHSYVRRNAVLAIDSMYQLPKGELLIPDAPELIDNFLRNEQDLSSKRNAFAMLAAHSEERAVRYLFENVDSVQNFGELLQMSVLDLIVKVCDLCSEFFEWGFMVPGLSQQAGREGKISQDYSVPASVTSPIRGL